MLNPETTSEHPCELAANCIYDRAAGSSDCAPGYTWENPDDLDNYNCVINNVCTPTSCEAQGYNCGDVPDGCDTILDTAPAQRAKPVARADLMCAEGSCTPTTCAAQGPTAALFLTVAVVFWNAVRALQGKPAAVAVSAMCAAVKVLSAAICAR